MLLLKIISTILKQLPTIINDLNKLGSSLKILDTMNVGTVGLNVGNIQAYQSAIKGLSAEQAVFALATKGANAAQIEEIMTTETATLAKGTYTQADVQAAMAKHGLATASAILTVEQQKEITNSGLLSAEKMAEMASVLGLTTAENGSLVSKKALNAEMVKQQLESIGIVGATQAQIMSILGLATAETGAVAGTNLLTASFAKLWAVISAHPIGALITAVGALAVGVVSAVNASNKAKEEARHTAIELTNTYTQEKDSLDSQIEKYKELKETLDNGNLSTDEARSIKEQLLGIQESLIESYGNEASNIDLVNGKYKEQLGLLSELSKEKATDYVTKNKDTFEDAKEALNKERTYGLGTVASWSSYVPKTEEQQALLDFIDSYSELLNLTENEHYLGQGERSYSATLSVKANVEDADKIMKQFYVGLENYGKENDIDVSGLLEGISKQRDNTWTDELAEYKTVYDEFMKAEIVRNDTLRPLYQDSIQAVEDYNKALSTDEGIEEAKANLESVQQSVQNATGELEGSQSVFDGIYEGINKDAEAAYNLGKAFENDKTVQSYAEQLRGLTDIDLKAINFDNDNTEKGEEAFKGLMETLGLTEEQVQSLINKLVELGYVQGEVQGSTLDNKIDVSFIDALSQVNDLSDGFKQLGEAYSDVKDKGNFDFTSLFTDDFKETFGGFTEEYENLIKTISESPDNIDACQSAFNNLATAYINSSDVLKNVTDETKASTIAMLEQMGVTNAATLVEERLIANEQELALKKEFLAKYGYDLKDATEATTKAFLDEAKATHATKYALFNYQLQEQIFNNSSLDVSGKVDKLMTLAATYGLCSELLEDYNTKKKLAEQGISIGTNYSEGDFNSYLQQMNNAFLARLSAPVVDFEDVSDSSETDYADLLEKETTLLEKQLETGIITFKEYTDKRQSIIEDYYKQGLISAEEYYSALEDMYDYQLSLYDKVIDAVNYRIDKEIDALEKEKESIEDTYNLKIESIQTEIDVLEKAREKREQQLELEKALYEVEKARSQRNVKLYSGTDRGVIYTNDNKELRETEENLENEKYESHISKLEEQIESLEKEMEKATDVIDEQIDALSNYADMWSDVADEYEHAQNDMLASQILGANYEEEILNQRMATLEIFKNNYIAAQNAMAEANRKVYESQVTGAQQNGGSTSGSKSSDDDATKNPPPPEVVKEKVSPSWTDAQGGKGYATSQIANYNGNGVEKGSDGKWYVYKLKKYHSGLDEGYVGDKTPLSKDKRLDVLQKAGNGDLLKSNEKLSILMDDELVLTKHQGINIADTLWQKAMMPSFNLPDYSYLNNIVPRNMSQPTIVNIGDIRMEGVQNVPDFAKALQKHLPNISVQYNGKH